MNFVKFEQDRLSLLGAVADAVTEYIEGLVETYPGLQYLDGFPEVDFGDNVFFPPSFLLCMVLVLSALIFPSLIIVFR